MGDEQDLEQRTDDSMKEYHNRLRKHDIPLSDTGFKWLNRFLVASYFIATIGCGTFIAHQTAKHPDRGAGGYVVAGYSYSLAVAPPIYLGIRRIRRRKK